MSKSITQILFLMMIALVPLALGDANTAAKTEPAEPVAEKPVKRSSNTCLASEEVIADIQAREQKLKEREAQLADREKELESQKKAVDEELAKLDAARSEIQGVHAQAIAEREEKVNKLIETFESMSPKAAAGVINGVDDELAVTALSRLSSVKAGKILANLHPEKSSRLSELMAFGRTHGKEKSRGESTDRAPANSKR